MNINESVSYLKGLVDGMDIDASKKENKLLLAIVDVLDEMAAEISDTQEAVNELDELVDNLDQDLGELENDFYECDDDDDCDCEGDEDLYEVTCPKCGDHIYLDEDMIIEGDTNCPNCGQKLEFDLSGCCDDEDCDCCKGE